MREVILSSTRSLCPVCLRRIPAWNVRQGDDVYLVKNCPEHGRFRTILWRGLPDYEAWSYPKKKGKPMHCATQTQRGCPFDCGLCPSHHHNPCAVLVEVTSRCNLRCPVCFAATGSYASPDPSASEIAAWYEALWQSAGQVNIQLSGGEPTVRDDLALLVRLAKRTGFDFVQINSNGLRLGQDLEYCYALQEAGLNCVFLQFDGLDDAVYQTLRGQALLERKLQAIEHCKQAGLGIVLAATLVPGVNTQSLWALTKFALDHVPVIRGMHFQPIGYIGRYPQSPHNEDRLTLPEVMRALEEQSNMRIKREFFLPPSGENAHCSFHVNLLQEEDGSLRPWVNDRSHFYAAKAENGQECGSKHAQAFMAKQWSGAQKQQTTLATTAQDDLDSLIARLQTRTLSLSAMAFQDVWSLDIERLKDCHIGIWQAAAQRIIPFCAYNVSSQSGATLYRGHN